MSHDPISEIPFLTAVGEALLRDRAHAQHVGDTIVTAATHPSIFLCLEDISHDCGAGAGHSNYSIPAEWSSYLVPDHEAALAELSEDDRSTFCIGEDTAVTAIAARSPTLGRVHHFLNAFFEDFESDLRP